MASILMRRFAVGGALFLGFGGASGMAFSSAAAVPKQESAFKQLSVKLKAIANLGRISALAEWDQLVMMPDRDETHEDRGDQLATLASVIHERSTEAALGALIAQAEAEALSDERDIANVREARKSYDRMVKIPPELAERKAKLASSAYASWTKARPANDFASFAPMLAECFAVAAEVAKYTRTDEAELYDVCLNEFEAGMTAARCEELFAEVQATLKPLIAKVLASPHQPSAAALSGSFNTEAQVALNTQIVRDLGFEHGRVDVSVHPFTTSFSPADVRITSRFREDEWYQGLAGRWLSAPTACPHCSVTNALTVLPADCLPLSATVLVCLSLTRAACMRQATPCTSRRSVARGCPWTAR
jgi:carboxypeptidase Taq